MQISVILPVYNAERWVAESVQSILDQTFTDFELLVVDDASTDGTAAVLRGLNDPRLRLISPPPPAKPWTSPRL
ncbi:MAG: glycosyltransferase [Gammaproteobacteria bacterium]|nr:glycosyltransferase [Gammaproteobacteria bacterium]